MGQHLVAVTLANVYCYPLFGAAFFPPGNLHHFCWEACLKPTNPETSSDIIVTLSQKLCPHISPPLVCVWPQRAKSAASSLFLPRHFIESERAASLSPFRHPDSVCNTSTSVILGTDGQLGSNGPKQRRWDKCSDL